MGIETDLAASRIPIYMRPGIAAYIIEGRPVDGFLTALLENDLKRVVLEADDENRQLLPVYVDFLFNNAPSWCWGSPARVDGWMKAGGLKLNPGNDHKCGITADGWGDGAELAR